MQYVTYDNDKSLYEKNVGSILGPILFLLYINYLTNVSDFFSILFVDDTNMFITGKDMDITCH